MSRVLVSDSLASQGLDVLRHAQGVEVLDRPGLSPGDLLEAIADVDGLVIRSGTKVTSDVIAAATKLRVIGRAGIGVDNVDVGAATARGIAVLNTPEGNNVTTAEHAISLLLSLARHIPAATASMKAGRWEKKKYTGTEIFNRTLGVVGLGNIGRIVALRALGLGMKVVAYDPHISREAATKLGVELVEFDELLSRVDAVTVHQVLRYADDPQSVIREVARVLRPGGRVAVVDFAPHDIEALRDQHAHRRLGFAHDEVAGWFKSAGLNPGAAIDLAGDRLKVVLNVGDPVQVLLFKAPFGTHLGDLCDLERDGSKYSYAGDNQATGGYRASFFAFDDFFAVFRHVEPALLS